MGRPRSLNPRFPWPSPQGPASHVTLSASSEGQVKGTPGYYSRTQGISPCRPITATIYLTPKKKRKNFALGVWVSWLAGWLAGWQAGLVGWQSRQARWLAGWPGWLANSNTMKLGTLASWLAGWVSCLAGWLASKQMMCMASETQSLGI